MSKSKPAKSKKRGGPVGKRPLVIRIWVDADGHERVQIKSGNGKILLASEAYESNKASRAVDVLTAELQDGNFRVEQADG